MNLCELFNWSRQQWWDFGTEIKNKNKNPWQYIKAKRQETMCIPTLAQLGKDLSGCNDKLIAWIIISALSTQNNIVVETVFELERTHRFLW